MEQTDHIEKQRQLRRVLDRVQQLPVLPGSRVHPGLRRDSGVGGQLAGAQSETLGSHSEVALTNGKALRISSGGQALAPWTLTLTMAVSSMVVATVTTVISLNVLQREQASPAAHLISHSQIESSPSVALDRSPSDFPGREVTGPGPGAVTMNVPATPAEVHDWAHLVPNANAPDGESEAGKQRATAGPVEHRTRRRAAFRGTIEQGPRASVSAVGDVLSGGL